MAAAFLVGDYAGFSGWPTLLSSNGTNAGTTTISTGTGRVANGGSFFNLGPGGLPFAIAGSTSNAFPLPGAASGGAGTFAVNGIGPGGATATNPGGNPPSGNGPGGNGGNGGNGNPGGTTTGPGQGGNGPPEGPISPGGPVQPPGGGQPPSGPTGGGGNPPPQQPQPAGNDGGKDEGKSGDCGGGESSTFAAQAESTEFQPEDKSDSGDWGGEKTDSGDWGGEKAAASDESSGWTDPAPRPEPLSEPAVEPADPAAKPETELQDAAGTEAPPQY